MTAHHAYAMPFGTAVMAAGGVRYRLWAPSVSHMQLHIESDPCQDYPMQRLENGWHELTLPGSRPSDRYRFLLPDGLLVSDPASRFNPDDVHAASEVIDPAAFEWPETDWCGRPWQEAIIYELHVGTFTAEGNFAGVESRLDYLVKLGITALEIMPVADFPGARNWGYDGVLLFAPDASYGRPEDFKQLITSAHAHGLMVILDVVYNHFGPEGNYLYCYCPEFFNPEHDTQWGSAINFEDTKTCTARDFFIHNALYWLEEYQLDGLRLDAIHAIYDNSSPDIVEELRDVIQNGPGRNRHVHLILENDNNQAHYLKSASQPTDGVPGGIAQWNDDFHHTLHVLTAQETDGYYMDFADDTQLKLTCCLSEGFAYQGEPSKYRNGLKRGEPSAHLPATAFINFLQTHDQIGNRALGERLCQLISPVELEAVTAILLLMPQIPLIFMGDEFAAAQAFLYFCDFGAELAQAVTNGRRSEFAKFAKFSDPSMRERIPDPNAVDTFIASRLDWTSLDSEPHRTIHALYSRLIKLRRQEIIPRLNGMDSLSGNTLVLDINANMLCLQWQLGDGSQLALLANLTANEVQNPAPIPGRVLFQTANVPALKSTSLPPWSVIWQLTEAAP